MLTEAKSKLENVYEQHSDVMYNVAYVDAFIPYPASYMIQATGIGITRNVTCVATEYAKRRDVAIMLKNTIDIPLVVTAGFDAETGAKYEIFDGTDGKEKRTLRTDLDKIIEQENNN